MTIVVETKKRTDFELPVFWLEQQPAATQSGLAVVILARDEASTLGNTVRRLRAVLGKEGEIHVVADHCTDATAQVARRAGAIVHIRSGDEPAGKGQALSWWVRQTCTEGAKDDVVVVLDADSQVAPDFFQVTREYLDRGEVVVQARLEPRLGSQAPVARLAAFSEIVEHRVNDTVRSRLRWPVRLRGTGMAFRRHIMERVSASLHTLVEDAELTILLGALGVPIAFAPETYVVDPKPYDENGAVRQRARWLRGQGQVLRSYPRQIMRLLGRGLPGWSLLSSVFLKPRTLLLPMKVGMVAAAWIASGIWGGWFWRALACAGTVSIGLDLGTCLYSLRYVENRIETLKALALTPAFLVLWLKSLMLSLVCGNGWLRSRPVEGEIPPSGAEKAAVASRPGAGVGPVPV